MLQTRQVNNCYPLTDADIQKFSQVPHQINYSKDILNVMNKLRGAELEKFKHKIDERYEQVTLRNTNYMLHDFIDDYVYIVYESNGDYHYFFKGKEAYQFYQQHGIKLERKTKDLFPKYETLIMNDKQGEVMSKIDYDLKYQRSNVKQVKFTLNKSTDTDLIKYLDEIENKNGYLKELIRQDMKKRQTK